MSADLQRLAARSVPRPGAVALENFAGDPDVAEFCQALLAAYELDVTFFVSWRCAPAVCVLTLRKPPGQHAVIRSERFDSLLVEYLHVMDHGQALVAEGFVLRVIGEFLIGRAEPGPAIAAFERALRLDCVEPRIPLRDELLQSIDRTTRLTLQCMCLAHEIGHVLFPRSNDATLATRIDGISLDRHLEVSLSEVGVAGTPLADQIRSSIPPSELVAEVEADLFAFDIVCRYLHHRIGCSTDRAVRASLAALEAQTMVLRCQSVVGHAVDRTGTAFDLACFVDGTQFAVRNRVVARRAGITWAALEEPDGKLTTQVVNRYVPRVDEILARGVGFRRDFDAHLLGHTREIREEFKQAPHERQALVEAKLASVRADARLRWDLYASLVAFGCEGGTDVYDYLRSYVRDHVPSSFSPSFR